MERIGESVRRAARGTALPEVTAVTAITRAWPAAVGDAIARAAWPSRLSRDGTLQVATVSSTWAFELTALAPQILERLREALREEAPPALRFVPGPVPEPPAPQPGEGTPAAVTPTPDERSTGASLAAVIEDEELRRTVARAAAASLARRRSGRAF
jgi:hypothetical protein